MLLQTRSSRLHKGEQKFGRGSCAYRMHSRKQYLCSHLDNFQEENSNLLKKNSLEEKKYNRVLRANELMKILYHKIDLSCIAIIYNSPY